MTPTQDQLKKELYEIMRDSILEKNDSSPIDEIVNYITTVYEPKVRKEERIRVIDEAVNQLSSKPICTTESPCGCHFGETFHADGQCACDIKLELYDLLSQLPTPEPDHEV